MAVTRTKRYSRSRSRASLMLEFSIERISTMKANVILNRTRYFRMVLILPAIAVLGLSSSSTADAAVKHNAAAKHNYRTGFVTIGSGTYNSESRGYDRPWPFGPESTQQ